MRQRRQPVRDYRHAITQASDFSTIHVATGTYTEQNITVDRNITITGAGTGATFVQAGTAPAG